MRYLVALLVLLHGSAPVVGAPLPDDPFLIRLDDSRSSHLAPPFHWFADPVGLLTVEEILAGGTAVPAFTANPGAAPNFGFTDTTYWVRLRIQNGASTEKRWLLELAYPFIDLVELYLVTGDGRVHLEQSGRGLPFFARKFSHRNHVFRLPLAPGEEVLCLLRLKSGSNISLPLRIWEREAFYARDHRDQLLIGLFNGMLLMMALYNLLLFFSLKDRAYLYFVSFLVNIALVQMGLNGISYEYLWPGAVYWNSASFLFFTALAIASILLFQRSFLATRRNSPRLHRLLSSLAILQALLAVFSFFLPYALMVRIISALAVLVCILVIATAFRALAGRQRAARYYLIAWLAFLVGGAMLVLRNFGVLPHGFLTMNGMQIGITFLVLFLSMALSERLSFLRREHEQLSLLEKELSIAGDVQAAILPGRRSLAGIRGYELDVRFLPMNGTVSGDYYGIAALPDGGLSLTIADAAGHGMQAALTTMQIDLLCRECRHLASPQERLTFLNNAWINKQISENFFTCFMADLHQDRLVYANAGHLPQYLLRKSDRSVIPLECPGPLVGFSADAHFGQGEIPLASGDVLLLFSDGIVEEFDPGGSEYGELRVLGFLQAVLRTGIQHYSMSAFNAALIRDIERFRREEPVNDDITLISIRVEQGG